MKVLTCKYCISPRTNLTHRWPAKVRCCKLMLEWVFLITVLLNLPCLTFQHEAEKLFEMGQSREREKKVACHSHDVASMPLQHPG